MENNFEAFKNKTRVLVLSTQPSVSKLLIHVLEFNDKEFDFYLENGNAKNSYNDFVILETSDLDKAAKFQPNIVLITAEIPDSSISKVLNNVIAGGVLVHHTNISETVDNAGNFFRKLPFENALYQKSGNSFILQTSLGAIPISNEAILQNIEGLQLLSQQFGILEENFYEPVMNFEF
ncbi:hypothetical protein FNJ88_10785 [Chryseobacterium sp. SNU WT5]|uniref:hypothetical protein n=1 Tax=Chryseobacterium sp. SNU WT5 TaxID=2594269 RepID=UPI00117C2306|nr:hypothetical protein [Chryseobacterium sp. SNU WT5]QDP86007.1 hypothetical protein FNJ88_10785 [Chryseobacterium sp. SNU WT5]